MKPENSMSDRILESNRRREAAMVRDASKFSPPRGEEEMRLSLQAGRTEADRVANAERMAAAERQMREANRGKVQGRRSQKEAK